MKVYFRFFWIPAFAGMTKERRNDKKKPAGMTRENGCLLKFIPHLMRDRNDKGEWIPAEVNPVLDAGQE